MSEERRARPPSLTAAEPWDMEVPPPGYLCHKCRVPGERSWRMSAICVLNTSCAIAAPRRPRAAIRNNKKSSRLVTAARLVRRVHLLLMMHLQSAGHYIRNCPFSPSGYLCKRCSTPGHLVQNCPLNAWSGPPPEYICHKCHMPGTCVWAGGATADTRRALHQVLPHRLGSPARIRLPQVPRARAPHQVRAALRAAGGVTALQQLPDERQHERAGAGLRVPQVQRPRSVARALHRLHRPQVI